MLALRKLSESDQNLKLCEVPEPTPAADQVVLNVAAAGICGTDIHILKGEYRSKPPVTLGHEVAGTIAALGEAVSGWELGQRVVSETYYSVCGHCSYCRSGRPNLCSQRNSIGSMVDGGFAEKLLVPASNLHALPDSLDFPEAALIEPLACVVRGVLELGSITAGDLAVITGPGPIGLLALQVAKAAGAQVMMIGTAADKERLALAQSLQADWVMASTADPETNARRVLELLGKNADVVIECSGAALAADLLLRSIKKAGHYIQLGLYGQRLSFDLDVLCYKELSVSGSFATVPSSWARAIALAASKAVSLKALVGASYPLSAWERAFADVFKRLPGKVLILPNDKGARPRF